MANNEIMEEANNLVAVEKNIVRMTPDFIGRTVIFHCSDGSHEEKKFHCDQTTFTGWYTHVCMWLRMQQDKKSK